MATAPELAKAANRQADGGLNVPLFELSPLPEKIARLDPAGAAKWVADNNQQIAQWIQKINGVNSGIVAKIKP